MHHSDDAEYQYRGSTWRGFTRLMTTVVIVVMLVLLGMAATLL